MITKRAVNDGSFCLPCIHTVIALEYKSSCRIIPFFNIYNIAEGGDMMRIYKRAKTVMLSNFSISEILETILTKTSVLIAAIAIIYIIVSAIFT